MRYRKKVPLFPLNAIYTDDPKVFNDFCYEHFDGKGLAGACVQMEASICIYVEPTENGGLVIPVVAHECFHAADMVADHVGIEYKKDSGNESIAYLVQWFTGFVMDGHAKHYKNVK